MICTILTASALVLLPVQKPRANSVDYFDSKIRVTERVLDRTICDDVARVQAPDAILMSVATERQKKALEEKAAYNAHRNAVALGTHCKNSPRVGEKNVRECDLVK